MKKIYYLSAILLLFLGQGIHAQTYTVISDTNFERALIDFDDIPDDGQIPTANISTVTTLNILAIP